MKKDPSSVFSSCLRGRGDDSEQGQAVGPHLLRLDLVKGKGAPRLKTLLLSYPRLLIFTSLFHQRNFLASPELQALLTLHASDMYKFQCTGFE